MSFRKEHRTKIRSTNPLERLNGEFKRRSDVVGIFPTEAAIYRLVEALLLEQNDERALQRRYMTLERLAEFGDNPNVSLPAVAAWRATPAIPEPMTQLRDQLAARR